MPRQQPDIDIDAELDRIRRERKAREAEAAKANGGAGTEAEQPRVPWSVPPMVWRPTVEIPRRQFLYGKHYARDFVSVTIGDGGIGKSALKLVEMLAMATGRNLLGITPTERVRCSYFGGDDPLVEIERRIHAVAQYFAIDLESLISEGWLFIGAADEHPLIIGEIRNGSISINPHALADIGKMIEDNKIGFAAFDPFKSLHRLPENSATEIDAIANVFSVVAARTHAAIGLDHHIRKPATGQVEATSADARGANALINKVRLSRVLNVMTPALAEQAGITEEQRGFYFRADGGKRNIAPPEKATWYHLVNVPLANGDDIGVPEPWTFPSPFADISVEQMHGARTIVRQGNYRKSPQAEDWVGKPIAAMLGLDPNTDRKRLIKILSTWFRNGVFTTEERRDERRHLKTFVAPGNWNEEGELT